MCLISFSKTLEHEGNAKMKHFNGSPVWANIVITDGCSHKCVWCYGAFYEHNNIMTDSDFKSLSEKLLDMGIKQVTISGGEPMESPYFEKIIKLAFEKGFKVHVATHGEHITEADLPLFLSYVDQVQFNFQGSKRHDSVHKVKGSYTKQVNAIKILSDAGVKTVSMTTIGKYNVNDLDSIFSEADALGVSRIRMSDVNGRGLPWRKMDVQELFDKATNSANKLGYKYVHSYDPDYKGDTGVGCMYQENLFIDIKPNSVVKYCGTVQGEHDIVDLKTDVTAKEALKAIKEYNKNFACDTCASRDYNDIQIEAVA